MSYIGLVDRVSRTPSPIQGIPGRLPYVDPRMLHAHATGHHSWLLGVGGSGLFEGRAVACSKAMRWFPRRPGSGLLEGRAAVCLKSGPRFARRPGTGLLEGRAGTAEKERSSGARGNIFTTDTTDVAGGLRRGWLHERLCGPSLCGHSGSFRVRSQSAHQICQLYRRYSRNTPQVSGDLPGNHPQLHGLDSGSST